MSDDAATGGGSPPSDPSPEALTRRKSVADVPPLVTDKEELDRLEARNGVAQYDYGVAVVQQALERGNFKLRPSLIQALHREALQGISPYAGNWRPDKVRIEGSSHDPAGAHLVSFQVEEMCDYVNDNWERSTALHLAAYVMWRLNWIHPFDDGNGRTSRIGSYVVLSVRSGELPNGSPTIPDLIVANRGPYFEALEAADAAEREGWVDVSAMETLLESLLAKQLTNYLQKAGGRAE